MLLLWQKIGSLEPKTKISQSEFKCYQAQIENGDTLRTAALSPVTCSTGFDLTFAISANFILNMQTIAQDRYPNYM